MCWLLFSVLLSSLQGPAQGKTLELEWEAQPRAQGYEVEVRDTRSAEPPRFFEVRDPAFRKDFPASTYRVRIRLVRNDGRKGRWSGFYEVDLNPLSLMPIFPPDQSTVKATGKMMRVHFRWEKKAGVKKYRFFVWALNQPAQSVTTTAPEAFIELPAQTTYMWGVTGALESGVDYQRLEQKQTFYLEGPGLPKPIFTNLSDQQIVWSPVNEADLYHLQIEQQSLDSEEWVQILSTQSTHTRVSVETLPPARYRFSVRALGKAHVPSNFQQEVVLIKPVKLIN